MRSILRLKGPHCPAELAIRDEDIDAMEAEQQGGNQQQEELLYGDGDFLVRRAAPLSFKLIILNKGLPLVPAAACCMKHHLHEHTFTSTDYTAIIPLWAHACCDSFFSVSTLVKKHSLLQGTLHWQQGSRFFLHSCARLSAMTLFSSHTAYTVGRTTHIFAGWG